MHKINIKKEKKDKTAVFKKPIGLFRNKFNKRIFVLGIIVAFLLIAGGAISTSVTNEMNINKKTNPGTNLDLYNEIEMNFNEPGGANDWTLFGEADDANDGPPADIYDMPKPPLPQTPYIRAWFNDNLPTPYDTLFKDYRHYSDTHKIWNLSVIWAPKGTPTTTILNISWNTGDVDNSEYDSVIMYAYYWDLGSSNWVLFGSSDMLVNSSFTYTAPPYGVIFFEIICDVDLEPPEINNNSPGSGETGDSYTFNATVTDNLFDADDLTVNVSWSHGSLLDNISMDHVSGNYFEKTITLDNYSVDDLKYHFYAVDSAKVPNSNYTSELSANVADDEYPNPISDDTTATPTTGDSITFGLTVTDNINVNYVYANYRWNYSGSWTSWFTDESMSKTGNAWTTSVLTVPEDTTGVRDVEYYFEVNDSTFTIYVYNGSLAVNESESEARGSPFSKPVNDDDDPTVTDVAVGTNPIYDGDLDQQITITYNEAMNTGVKPTVQITGITTPKSDSTSGTWTDATHYVVTITLDDDNEEDDVLDIVVSGAEDVAGNTQPLKTENNPFIVDTKNPTVTSVAVDTPMVYDGDLTQQVTVTYSEVMVTDGSAVTVTYSEVMVTDGSADSSITFSDGAWSPAAGVWDGTSKIWTQTFTLTDAGEEFVDVDVSADGAKDAAGNSQVAKTENDLFDIDTKNPTPNSSTCSKC